MKKLISPELNANDVYMHLMENARSKEKKERLLQLQPYVYSRYDIYTKNALSLENISESKITEENDKSTMQSCYNRNSKGYLEGEVVAEIIGIQSVQHKNKCPYCGLDRPRTIDHYLPKSDFPEFSVFPSNLIPCCQYCNGKKGDRWIRNGKRIFLNLYYDEIPEVKYLHTNIELNKADIPLIRFTLSNNGEINPYLFEIIQEHYAALDLLKQFSLNVEDEISNINDHILHDKLSIETQKRTLRNELASSIRRYGINFWKSSFLDALLECDVFFEKYQKQALV